ncbi:DUF3043 domain-containing protein [Ornithinimicrobium cerasi]|uniref:DUF3043 domain-containing protein n=1 Tax=Ornithinimicrobium cerasi TaxID=2248773 RepID=UPI000EFEE96A|nr:DUF3043 domain-containing protein [Ornithinimicrobium cerasi]
MLFSKRSTEPKDQAVAAPTAAADGSRPTGKGRPTPKRREAEAANRRPLVGGAAASKSPDAKARARAERARAREAMLRGDEKYLTPRDRGPERRFLRDAVDSRRTFGEILLPAMLVILALTFIPQAWAGLVSMVGAYSLMMLTILGAWLLWRQTKARFVTAFGHEPSKGSAMYVVLRSFQMRGSRIPRPAVKPGDPLVRR